MRTIWAASCRITDHSGCCERGVVPHAPSRRGGMYVTGDGAAGGIVPGILVLAMGGMFGVRQGEDVFEIRGMVWMVVDADGGSLKGRGNFQWATNYL